MYIYTHIYILGDYNQVSSVKESSANMWVFQLYFDGDTPDKAPINHDEKSLTKSDSIPKKHHVLMISQQGLQLPYH